MIVLFPLTPPSRQLLHALLYLPRPWGRPSGEGFFLALLKPVLNLVNCRELN